MTKTNYLEDAVINHLFGGSALAQPTEWWVSIYQADPGEDPTLGITPELGTRKEVTSWSRVSNQSTNTNQLTFDTTPVSTTWVITHFTIWDDETGGNPIHTGVLNQPQTRTEGQALVIEAGNLTVTED